MPHSTSLIATLVSGLGLAFIFGALAHRLRLSPLVGYLLAGVMIGPFAPGLGADQSLTPQLAEIGVILLMFGVGLHFSLPQLMAVRAVAIPGAIGQILVVTFLGFLLTRFWGWTAAAGLIFGLALSVVSTVVVMRAFQERRLIETDKGRIAIGWLVVQDFLMILALVMLPALADVIHGAASSGQGGRLFGYEAQNLWQAIGFTLVKLVGFLVLMLVVGQRVIPRILHEVAYTGSRELFRLAVLAIALGVAYGSAILFDVSFALGAFFAGLLLAESELSQRAAQETLPLRDAFAVLFFVSVGILFDPTLIWREPLKILTTFLVIVLGNLAVVALIMRASGYPLRMALSMGASLSQIGEFSFILAGLGVSLKLLPEVGQDLILSGALLSILINPVLFVVLSRMKPWILAQDASYNAGHDEIAPEENRQEAILTLTGHTVLAGCGRVGSLVAEALAGKSGRLLVIEEREEIVADLKARGIAALIGNGSDATVLHQANLAGAHWFISAIPDVFENGQAIQQARAANAKLPIIARSQTETEAAHLRQCGADLVVLGEQEIARAITRHILREKMSGE
jgi:monovalent cation:H+ antiporter-2, CPA2 family